MPRETEEIFDCVRASARFQQLQRRLIVKEWHGRAKPIDCVVAIFECVAREIENVEKPVDAIAFLDGQTPTVLHAPFESAAWGNERRQLGHRDADLQQVAKDLDRESPLDRPDALHRVGVGD
jgi:hypothetical protein